MKTVEIERKFLIDPSSREELAKYRGIQIRQGYLSSEQDKTIRIRIKGDSAFLTVKGKTTGISRTEIETLIPTEVAEKLFESFITQEIKKIRREVIVEGKCWEVDEFLGRHKGLWLAELELESETEHFSKPHWLGREVSQEKIYFNSYLAEKGLEGVPLI